MAHFLSFITLLFLIQKKHQLTIEIEGVEHAKGNIHLAIFKKKSNFPATNSGFKNKIQSCNDNTIIFQNLDSEEYAIAVFLDENKNGIMDTNLFGAPTEKYGFSNNARGVFSSPSFEEASFELKSDKKIKILIK